MGSATSYHLAKNIGINIAKPARHLSRIAQKLRLAVQIIYVRLYQDMLAIILL